jgi:mono/diheme cytochrome c family protein
MLAAIDRILAPLSWLAAAALVVMLFAGPAIVADDKDSAAQPAAKAGASPYAKPETAKPDGKALFTANCGSCHTLAKAGTSGSVGPALDKLAFGADTIEELMRSGTGVMPSFEDKLAVAEIAAVAAYVAG